MATRSQRRGAETVLHDVRVVAVDQKLDSKEGEEVIAKNVTLEVTPKQSEIIAVGQRHGQVVAQSSQLTRSAGR